MTYVAVRRPVRPQPPRAAAKAGPAKADLVYQGQGTVQLALAREKPFTVTFRPTAAGASAVRWRIEKHRAVAEEQDARLRWSPCAEVELKQGLKAQPGSSYWFSVDCHNRAIRFGMGEMRRGTMVGEHVFAAPAPGANPYERLATVASVEVEGPVAGPLAVWPDPVVVDPPPRVLPHDVVTMEDLGRGAVTVPGSLSPVCQRLYDNVGGARFELDTPDFPEFSRAIAASILDPNGWCAKKLKEKADFFHTADATMGYLRITLGTDEGESPGIPFVLEIWPSGHKSPIHNHAGADAVIRVLHGAIQVRMFSMLTNPMPAPFAIKTFSKGDVTWITSRLNQIHQLENFGEEPCITIQCYMYESDDPVHQPGFSDLIDGEATSFLPYPDADFLWFKKKMREEWYGVPDEPKPLQG